MRLKTTTWEPVACIDFGARDTQWKAVVLHTAVSKASDLFSFWKTCPGVGAHIYVNAQGKAYQYIDTDRMSYHAYAANPWTVAIETWDNAASPIPAWNAAQVATIVAICKELGVPAQLLQEQRSNGVGYHRLYPSWNQSGHTCPGDLRAAQVSAVIIPALTGGDHMAVADEYIQAVKDAGVTAPAWAAVFMRELGKRNRALFNLNPVLYKALDRNYRTDVDYQSGWDAGP